MSLPPEDAARVHGPRNPSTVAESHDGSSEQYRAEDSANQSVAEHQHALRDSFQSHWEDQTTPRDTTSSVTTLICGFALHLLLVVSHIVFIVVRAKGLERRVVYPLGPFTDRLSAILPATTQVVWTLYLAIMLLVTQELALRKMFATTQLLTATHDGLSAWSGVGSALLGLFRQSSLSASFLGVFYVAMYLVAAHVLHITAPSLITLSAANSSRTTPVVVSNARPIMFAYGAEPHSAAASAAGGLLPVLGQSQVLTTPGLDGHILYDVPVREDTTGIVDVSMLVVDVQCGALPDAKQVGRKSDLSWTVGANHSGSAFMFDLGFNQTEAGNLYIQPNSLHMGLSLYDNPSHQFANGTVYWQGSGTATRPIEFTFPISAPDTIADPFYGANLVFWSFVNVTDDANANASYVPLSPAYPIAFMEQKGESTLGQGIQVIGCTISTDQQRGKYDANLKQLLTHPERSHAAAWKTWEPALYDRDTVSKGFTPSMEEMLGMVMTMLLRDKGAVLEYLARQSGPPLTTYDASWNNAYQPSLVKLDKFEDAVTNATAAVLWTATRIGRTSRSLFRVNRSVTETVMTVPALRLNINLTPLIAGFVASCVLFVMFWLVAPVAALRGDLVTGPGMLQIIWLFADSAAQRRVAAVADNKVSVDTLRQSGMFPVLASGIKDATGTLRHRAVVEGDVDSDYERLEMNER